MAMRLYSAAELEDELLKRGCTKTNLDLGFGRLWKHPDGRSFFVPPPEEPGGSYPDWMLDELIRIHRLPPARPN